MCKFRHVVLAGFMLFLLSGMSNAAEHKFGDLTLSAAGDCVVKEADGHVVVTNSTTGHFFSVAFLPDDQAAEAKKMDPQEFAKALSSTLGGTAPEKDKAGDYAFNVIKSGTDMHVVVVNKDKFIALYMHDRKDSDWPQCLSDAYDSIKANTLEKEGFLSKYFFVDR